MPFSLKLFGGISLEGSRGPITGPAAQRHRLALLALLATSPRQTLSRDKLIAWLWQERDAEHARGLLNQTVHALRRELGDAALLSVGDDLRLNAAIVHCDVIAFGEALAVGEHARAAGLYTGPFLDGFFLSDAREFEHWVDRERERLAAADASALEVVAAAAEARQDMRGAAEWWRARAAHDPHSGRVALRLMRALEAAGDRAGALRHARTHTALLREEFDAEPDPEVTAFAERLRVAPSARSAPEPVAIRTALEPLHHEPAPAGSGEKPAARRRRARGYPAAVATLVLALAIVGVYGIREAQLAVRPVARSVAVLPFENLSGDPGEEYFSDGLTEELIAALSQLQSLRVVARTSVFAFKGENRDVREIGQALNVATVVEGSVRRQGDRLRVTAQLINAADGFHIWSATYDERRVLDIFDIQRDVALRIAGALDAELTPRDRERLARRPTENPGAHVLFLKGRYFVSKRTGASLATAIEYLERAIAVDPRYARAHAELASAYALLGVHDHMAAAEAQQRMQRAALRATEIDPDLAEARAALGAYRLLYEWDWTSAEREFRRAIALDPGYATAHLRYGFLLESLGRFDEAVAEIRISQELDPLATAGHSALGFALFLAGHADQALEHVGHALELDATDWMAHSQLGQIEEALGDLPAAIRAYQSAVAHSGAATKPRASLARARALSGREDEARRLLAALVAEATRTGHTPVVATVMLALGDTEGAIGWLENAYRQRHPDLLRIPADPRFAALRDDRRFLDLLARIGLLSGR